MDPLIRRLRRRLLAWLHRSRSDQIYFMRRLSYKDVKRATDGFHRIIYSNSQVAAYTAKFEDGSVSLVKEVKDFDQADDVFSREVQFLGRLYHRHLLSLKGFSLKHKRLLIFDSIENGSLKDHLNGNLREVDIWGRNNNVCTILMLFYDVADPLKTPLNWRTRLQIAIGVVAALEYLFLFVEKPLCHVSISSSSIMLDDNFTAKLSDFGLLTCVGNPVMMPNSKDDSTRQKSGNIIFQLGVFILELVTGQSSEMEGSDLIEWIQESRFYSSIDKMVDPDLGDNYDSRELKTLLAVAKLCIKSWDKPVFTIPQLFRYLQQQVDIPRD